MSKAERIVKMDKLFYTVEMDGENKTVHILGDVYYNGSGIEGDTKVYRSTAFTW